MFCINCGNKFSNNDKFCTNCGVKLETINNVKKEFNNNDNGLKIASIVLGSIGIGGAFLIIFAPVSLILSIIGLVLGLCALKKGSNVLGILLSSIGLVISLIVTVIMLLIFIFAFESVSGYEYEDFFGDEFGEYYYDYGLEDF